MIPSKKTVPYTLILNFTLTKTDLTTTFLSRFILSIAAFLSIIQAISAQFVDTDEIRNKIEAYKKTENFSAKDTTYIMLLNDMGRSFIYTSEDSLKHYVKKHWN